MTAHFRPFALLTILCLGLGTACSGVDDPGGDDSSTGGSMSFEDPNLGTGGATAGTGGAGMATGGNLATGGGPSTSTGGAPSGGAVGVGGDPIPSGGTGGVASSGGSTGTGGEGTGGAPTSDGGSPGTGGSPGECIINSPPSEHVQTIEATWDEMTGQISGNGARPPNASILNFDNSIMDQIFENDGTLNYCVRWESNATLSATNRDKLEDALERNINQWIDQLEGQDCFPYDHIPVKVVGWAAMNRSSFGWADNEHPGLMYIGDDSFESAPQCAQACGRFFNKQPGYQYPSCSGGRANHYDMSLWLTAGMNGGAGGDWGQRIGQEYFIGAIDQSTIHILSHEMGHGFGFPDYYNWGSWFPGLAPPHTIMNAGASAQITDWDTWMMRRLWSELKTDRF